MLRRDMTSAGVSTIRSARSTVSLIHPYVRPVRPTLRELLMVKSHQSAV